MSFETHRTNSGEREYASLLMSKKAQENNNPYVMGIQPDPKYGAVDPDLKRDMDFSQPDTAGNIAPPDVKSTGNAEMGVSATTEPNRDPQEFQQEYLMATLQKIANGENRNYNDHSQII